jgi:hypothetical protein
MQTHNLQVWTKRERNVVPASGFIYRIILAIYVTAQIENPPPVDRVGQSNSSQCLLDRIIIGWHYIFIRVLHHCTWHIMWERKPL